MHVKTTNLSSRSRRKDTGFGALAVRRAVTGVDMWVCVDWRMSSTLARGESSVDVCVLGERLKHTGHDRIANHDATKRPSLQQDAIMWLGVVGAGKRVRGGFEAMV